MKVLYHANCNDGSGAALAAWMHIGDSLSTREAVEYIPVQYGSDPPFINHEEVFILDFSYPRDVLLKLSETATRITVIDHHKTAQADLAEPFPPGSHIHTVFDMDKSGAVLTWEYFHDMPVPGLLKYVQDRDLWRFEFPDTKSVAAGLQLYPSFRDWRQFVTEPGAISALMVSGDAIIDFLAIQTEKIIDTEPRHWDIENVIVPVYNIPGFMISDTLHAALERYPVPPYAVGYFDLPDKRVYSLRSRQNEDVDVSEIAKRHGGGGHKHAAGFTAPL